MAEGPSTPASGHDHSSSNSATDFSDEDLLQLTKQQNKKAMTQRIILAGITTEMETEAQFISALLALPKSVRIPG